MVSRCQGLRSHARPSRYARRPSERALRVNLRNGAEWRISGSDLRSSLVHSVFSDVYSPPQPHRSNPRGRPLVIHTTETIYDAPEGVLDRMHHARHSGVRTVKITRGTGHWTGGKVECEECEEYEDCEMRGLGARGRSHGTAARD